jgi:hypothetical protein
MVLFRIPNAVELSVRRGVGGCVWPRSVSVTLSGAHSERGATLGVVKARSDF